MTKTQKAEREEYRAKLLDMLKPGDTIYTVHRHTSRSGMYRAIDAYVIREERPFRLSYWIAKACGMKYDDKHEAIGIDGCGMDMGFHIVYSLSSTLFPDGYDCIGDSENYAKRCPSNDHSNGDRSYSPDNHHRDGGYALRQAWQ